MSPETSNEDPSLRYKRTRNNFQNILKNTIIVSETVLKFGARHNLIQTVTYSCISFPGHFHSKLLHCGKNVFKDLMFN